MAGGVALNCVMNARLRDAGIFDEVWVQPAAGDAGTALGAALCRCDGRARRAGAERQRRRRARRRAAPRRAVAVWTMDHAYLGPGFDDDEIEEPLRWASCPYRRMTTTSRAETGRAAAAQAAIVGWFQGRMEFGPARARRALDPRFADRPRRCRCGSTS